VVVSGAQSAMLTKLLYWLQDRSYLADVRETVSRLSKTGTAAMKSRAKKLLLLIDE